MPPFLRHGKAAKQRRVVFPPLLVLCRCSECIATPFFDQETNQVCFGRFVTEVQHRKHIREDSRKRLAAQNYAAETANHICQDHPPQPLAPEASSPAEASSPHVLAGQPSDRSHGVDEPFDASPEPPPLTRRVRRHLAKTSSTPTVSNSDSEPNSEPRLTSQLAELKVSLEAITSCSFREGFERCPPLFVHLPGSEVAEAEQTLDLNSSAHCNHSFLQHERFLYSSRTFLEASLNNRHSSRADKLRAQTLLVQVNRELADAHEVKKESWERQRRAFVNTNTIDTSM